MQRKYLQKKKILFDAIWDSKLTFENICRLLKKIMIRIDGGGVFKFCHMRKFVIFLRFHKQSKNLFLSAL